MDVTLAQVQSTWFQQMLKYGTMAESDLMEIKFRC